jgi:hypothetical protein
VHQYRGLAEFYSVLTRAPFTPRVHRAEAGRFLGDNILPYLELIALASKDYKDVLPSCADAGSIGGVVFDALHLRCAQKGGCDRIYSLKVKDFRSLARPILPIKLPRPEIQKKTKPYGVWGSKKVRNQCTQKLTSRPLSMYYLNAYSIITEESPTCQE